MERAACLLGKIKLPRNAVAPEDMARAAWRSAVGEKIAAHTTVVGLVRTRLVVEVGDAIWQRQLNTLASQIVRNLQAIVGPGIIDDLDLRPAIAPRRAPQRSEAVSTVPASQDEADAISDRAMRRVYKISRKKAAG
jgi:predicted nucleic acid-binding Zn ribbon protein